MEHSGVTVARLLVVHEYMRPGTPQDHQRGEMYADLFRRSGMEPAFMGRRPLPGLFLSGLPARLSRHVRGSLIYRAWYRAVVAVVMRLNHLRILRAARTADVVLLINTDSFDLVRRIREASRARLVYDVADVRTRYRPDRTRETERILSNVDAVTCDNRLTMRWASELNPRVHLWPQASYIEAFDARRHVSRRSADDRVRLGWVGTPSTSSSLYLILESLEDVSRAHANVDLRLLGLPDDHEILGRFEHVRATWRERYATADMIEEVLHMDVGLFPTYDLQDTAWKGVTKALIYMAGGAAVVCSPVGVVRDLVRDGENGLLASGRSEWTTALSTLIADPGSRARMADAGRQDAERHSLDLCFSGLQAALRP